MGGIVFDPETLSDSLSELAGYKAGLSLSIDQLCELFDGTEYPELIRSGETQFVRLRVEQYEGLYYKLLHRIGYTEEEYDGDITGARLFHKYRRSAPEEYLGVIRLLNEMWPKMMDDTMQSGSRTIDPTPFVHASFDKYGRIGAQIALERIRVIDRGLHLSPHSTIRYVEWKDSLTLDALFQGTDAQPEVGRFIDQRFIDYLSANADKLSKMHWRKFEELAAEYFHREGYRVELGPGSNDDGVDIRVWKPGQNPSEKPQCLVQCKRQKAKVEKVVVKGLHADVTFEGAEYGLIVTTAELSPGARQTIAARGYPIREIERTALDAWLVKLRTPGTGIVRV